MPDVNRNIPTPPLKLVTTTGPSTFGKEVDLVGAGATTIRLNASHLTPDEVLAHATRILETTGADCVVDLQGAKMRLAALEPRPVSGGDVVRFSSDPTERTSIHVPHPELFEQVSLGEVITLDDGRLRLTVTEVGKCHLCARASHDYVILSRKGINRENHPIDIHDLGPHDLDILSKCAGISRISFAISFVKDGSEAAWVRSRVPRARVTLKIERQEALDHLDTLATKADELWICRGDLGAQLGLDALGRAIAALAPLTLERPVLMAGQVFEHLTEHDAPTRSEVCHLYDLLTRGYAGIVLSDETAIGKRPVNAATWSRRLLDTFRR